MSDFQIKKATRQGVRPLICLYAESGCGKTMSALLLARGFVGPKGRIVMADSESGRGSLYADVIEGGYDVIDLTEPFSSERYVDVISAVEQSGAAIGVLDSGSHEWEGIGGVLDYAGENEAKSGKAGLHNWKTPKFNHAKFMLKLLKSPIPWVICLRAKYKTRQGKDERGKTCIIKDDHVSPIQAEDFIFECTAHAEVLPDHSIHLTKCSHPALRDCFPAKGPITTEHGAKIAAWCAAPSISQGAALPVQGSNNAVDRAAASSSTSLADATPKTRDWMLSKLADIHPRMLAFGIDKGLIMPDASLDEWPLNRTARSKSELDALRKEIENHV